MSRKAVAISIEELKEKTAYLFEEPEDYMSEEFPYNLPVKVEQDIGKIEFSMENYFIGDASPTHDKCPDDANHIGYPTGYKMLDNGVPVLFIVAGGDWEFPVCFCIYWDGTQLRGYFPTKGNVFNKKHKAAHGNYDGDDFDYSDLRGDEKLIMEDVANRLQALDKEAVEKEAQEAKKKSDALQIDKYYWFQLAEEDGWHIGCCKLFPNMDEDGIKRLCVFNGTTRIDQVGNLDPTPIERKDA